MAKEDADEPTYYLPFAIVIPFQAKSKRMLILSKVGKDKLNTPSIKFIFDNAKNKSKIDDKHERFKRLVADEKLYTTEELISLIKSKHSSDYKHIDPFERVESALFVISNKKYAIIQSKKMEFGSNILAGSHDGQFYTFVKLYNHESELQNQSYISKEEDWNLIILPDLKVLPKYCGLIFALSRIFENSKIPILTFSTFDSELIFFPSKKLQELILTLDKIGIKWVSKEGQVGS